MSAFEISWNDYVHWPDVEGQLASLSDDRIAQVKAHNQAAFDRLLAPERVADYFIAASDARRRDAEKAVRQRSCFSDCQGQPLVTGSWRAARQPIRRDRIMNAGPPRGRMVSTRSLPPAPLPASRTTPDRRRILFVGKLIARKRPADLLHAVARVGREQVEVAFAARGSSNPSSDESRQNASVRADFMGFVNQSWLPAVYAAVDLLVLPSDDRQTWGLVVNKAMACGLPAVVSMEWAADPTSSNRRRRARFTPWATSQRSPLRSKPSSLSAPITFDAVLQLRSRCIRQSEPPAPSSRQRRPLVHDRR